MSLLTWTVLASSKLGSHSSGSQIELPFEEVDHCAPENKYCWKWSVRFMRTNCGQFTRMRIDFKINSMKLPSTEHHCVIFLLIGVKHLSLCRACSHSEQLLLLLLFCSKQAHRCSFTSPGPLLYLRSTPHFHRSSPTPLLLLPQFLWLMHLFSFPFHHPLLIPVRCWVILYSCRSHPAKHSLLEETAGRWNPTNIQEEIIWGNRSMCQAVKRLACDACSLPHHLCTRFFLSKYSI